MDEKPIEQGQRWQFKNSQKTSVNRPRLRIESIKPTIQGARQIGVVCIAENFVDSHGFTGNRRAMYVGTLRAEWEPC